MSERPGGPLKILRFLERGDPERLSTLPPFEGFVFNPSVITLDQAGAVRVARPEVEHAFAYYNVLERGHVEEDDGSGDPLWRSPWFDYVREHMPPLISPVSGLKARFPWGRKSTMFDWSRLGYRGALAAVDKALEAAPGFGLYGDQAYLWAKWWMFDDTIAPIGDWPPHYWIIWHWAMMYLALEAGRREDAAGQPLPALFNGDDQLPGARHYEHAEWDWTRTVERWKADYTLGNERVESVLSVDAMADWTIPWVLDEWSTFGGWISFTTSTAGAVGQAAVDQAYARAVETRTRVGG
jgi:hypothetical protein